METSAVKHYEGYHWIKVPKYKMDKNKSWEERYQELDAHHVKETTFLINEIRRLAQVVDTMRDYRCESAV